MVNKNMRFAQFFYERFVENNHGILYVDPTPDEFWKHVIPNITGEKSQFGDRLGIVVTANHIYYFDRTEMEHPTVFYNFIKGKVSDDLDNILNATVTKKGFAYIIHPAYYSMKAMNLMGYNDAKPKKGENQVQAFLKNGGMKNIENLVNNHPHFEMLKNKKPLGYSIRIDYSEGLR